MKNPYIAPSLIISASILIGFWMLKQNNNRSSNPSPIKVVTKPYIPIYESANSHYRKNKRAKELILHHIAFGTDLNEKDKESGFIALHDAAIGLDADIVKLLINNGSNINEQDKNGRTPLHLVFIGLGSDYSKGNIYRKESIIDLLVDAGASLDITNNEGETPLLSQGDPEIAKILVEKGSNIFTFSKYNSTALTKACEMDDREEVD